MKRKSNPIFVLISYYFPVIVAGILLLCGFLSVTGIGQAYNVFNRTQNIVIFAFFTYMFIKYKTYHITKKLLLILSILTLCSVIHYSKGEHTILNYIWVWLLIPAFASMTITTSQYKWICRIHGLLGAAIVYATIFTSMFSGWDGNSVAMMIFFCYTAFIAVYVNVRDMRNVFIIVVFSLFYFYGLNKLNSRSAGIFSFLLMLSMLNIIPLKAMMNKKFLIFILLVPLIVAVVISLIKDMSFIDRLNEWSYSNTNKPLFNGRDKLWAYGLRILWDRPFIGQGNKHISIFAQLGANNWHNSAVTTLVDAGITGYVILLYAVYYICSAALKFIKDDIVYGLLLAFLFIWLQQTVEMGLIAMKPSIVPYIILALLYSRVVSLEKLKNKSEVKPNES